MGDLVFGGACPSVDLNGLDLYYRNGGDPKQLYCGDCGSVGDGDFSVLPGPWGAGSGGGTVMTEPGTLAMLALGGLAALLKRRVY